MEINGNVEMKSVGIMCNINETVASQQLMLPPSRSVDISFKNLSYSVKTSFFSRQRKYILKGVSGLFKSGELTAIMGPSGAGKSTLLNVLSGYINTDVKGTIYANDTPVDKRRQQTKNHSGYIMQDDYFNDLFTVSEIMKFAADCKLGYTTSPKSKELLIEDILDSMAMSETRNTLCGKLSGGQKKRLNVSLELINNPSVLYLDEPTSGLDSLSSHLLVSKLKGLARSGRTVICTIHQPSAGIFSMFDHLYVIAGGKAVYQGDADNLLPFLDFVGLPCPQFHNPADFIMDVVCGEFGSYNDKLVSALENNNWRKCCSIRKDIKEKTAGIRSSDSSLNDKPSELYRYFCLVPKLAKQLHRDWMISYMKLMLHILVGLVVGMLFQGFGNNGAKVYSNLGYFFLCILYICFTSMMPAALKFPAEVQVLKKEHFNNWYKFTTHFFALLTVHLPVQMLFCASFGGISYILTGQPLECYRIIAFSIALVFTVIISELIGLFMGTMKNPVNGVFNGSVLLAVFILLAGFLVFIKDMPPYLDQVTYAGFFRYCFEIMVLGQYGANRATLDCPTDEFYCHFRNPKVMIIDMLGIEDGIIPTNITILSAYTVVVAVLTYYRLKYRLKNFT